MPRDKNTIAKMRRGAWTCMGWAGHWDAIWLGEDFLAIDELCMKMYAGLKAARKGMKKGKALEAVATAMHAFEEVYDVGADGKVPPITRPPEITAELRAKYGEIIED